MKKAFIDMLVVAFISLSRSLFTPTAETETPEQYVERFGRDVNEYGRFLFLSDGPVLQAEFDRYYGV